MTDESPRRRDIAGSIARVFRVFGAGIGSFTRDCVVLAGAGSIAYGAWLYQHPLGFIVGGVLAIAGSVTQELAKTSDGAGKP